MNGKKQDGAVPSMEQAKALAGSPAARELMALLRQKGGDELQNALNKAAQGDMEAAKQALSPLLSSPEVQQLLKQLGR
jgi:hypothetical protein